MKSIHLGCRVAYKLTDFTVDRFVRPVRTVAETVTPPVLIEADTVVTLKLCRGASCGGKDVNIMINKSNGF